MSRRLTRQEQETVIRWNAADPMAEVWTCQPKILRKLKRLGYAPVRTQGPGAWFQLPKDRISIRRPRQLAAAASPGMALFSGETPTLDGKTEPISSQPMGRDRGKVRPVRNPLNPLGESGLPPTRNQRPTR